MTAITKRDFFDKDEVVGLVTAIHEMMFLKHIMNLYCTKKLINEDVLFVHLHEIFANSFIIMLHKLGKDSTSLSIPSLQRAFGKKSPLTKDELAFIGNWRGNWAGHNKSFSVDQIIGKINADPAINLGDIADKISDYYFQLGVELNNPHFVNYNNGAIVANIASEKRAVDLIKRLSRKVDDVD